jgi:hypothetical protein
MTDLKRPLKVFLCHAHDNAGIVHELYDHLIADGVAAWLDTEKLIGGQDWEYVIRKAVRESDVFIVCLSKQFVQKGFRHKEVRIAMDEAALKPEGKVFIIPLRLEECNVPQYLNRWHKVDLFEIKGYESLRSVLQTQALSIGATFQVKSRLSSWIQEMLEISTKARKSHDSDIDIISKTQSQEKVQRRVAYRLAKEKAESQTTEVVESEKVEQEATKSKGIFISYSRNDIEFVDKLAKDLISVGMDPWWDVSRLMGGDTWTRSIQSALDKSHYCIVVITPDSIRSPWVEREYTYAFNIGLTVVPIYLKSVEKLPFSFSTIHYIDFRDNNYSAAIRKLYLALKLPTIFNP